MDRRIKLSRDQEQRIAARRGGSRNPGSGSGWKSKNDVRDDEYLWEMKRTDAKQITVKLADLLDVRRNAILEGKLPAFHIEIGTTRAVLLMEDDFFALLES